MRGSSAAGTCNRAGWCTNRSCPGQPHAAATAPDPSRLPRCATWGVWAATHPWQPAPAGHGGQARAAPGQVGIVAASRVGANTGAEQQAQATQSGPQACSPWSMPKKPAQEEQSCLTAAQPAVRSIGGTWLREKLHLPASQPHTLAPAHLAHHRRVGGAGGGSGGQRITAWCVSSSGSRWRTRMQRGPSRPRPCRCMLLGAWAEQGEEGTAWCTRCRFGAWQLVHAQDRLQFVH